MALENDSLLQAANYVDGEMSAEERAEFELQMQADAELREYVAQYREANTALRRFLVPDSNAEALKQTLGSLNQQYFKPEAKVVSFGNYSRWLSAVAAVLILGIIVFNPFRRGLYEEYNTATTMSVAERGDGAETNLEKAAAFYNNKEFTKAEGLLAKEYTADTKNSLIAYYYALTLIEDKQEAKAREILQQLYNGESAFKYDAAYYVGLSYVKQKDNANAKVWLQKVAAGTSNYQKARELLGKL
ncbi:anti-sigma factor [Mucilaginibacter pedocola]|uniref:Zinc-finger domain-containing protein n=1 Tax=Mucilaginibacter pedocola TaxID=1792845 RepID=A0A1S9PFZ3_9SPHI|nr:hypothetical protein [Mucilaginibacter pedocola]OOQ59817.1 hypothetical protein BC343_06635 [Mucilaginibacter pedocola]